MNYNNVRIVCTSTPPAAEYGCPHSRHRVRVPALSTQSMGARTLDTSKLVIQFLLNEQNHRESTVGENVLVRLSKVLIFVIIYLNFLKICVCICSVRYCMLIRLLNVSFLVNPKTHQPGPDHQRHVKFLSYHCS